MEFKLLRSMDNVNEDAFLDVFKQSTEENAPVWYPEVAREAAIAEYERGFLEYMHGQFREENGALALLYGDDGRYVSSLRLYPDDKAVFLIEALEVRPDCRGKGFGSEIIRNTITALEYEYGKVELRSYTGKRNIASIRAHEAAGMVRVCEYWENENGERDETQVTFAYKTA